MSAVLRPLCVGIVALATGHTCQVRAAPVELPPRCLAAIEQRMPQWLLLRPPLAVDAARFARDEGIDPSVTRGDFDRNGVPDYAALGWAAGGARLAICLNPGRRTVLIVVDDPYCHDLVTWTPAGTVRHDFEAERDVRLRRDAVSVSCFEKAGASYVVEGGTVRRIVDSD